MKRPSGPISRDFEHGGLRWRAVEAWRSEGGHGLCYFLRLEEGTPDPDDRDDRRTLLEPGEELGEVEEARLGELLERAVPLTETERRFRARDGALWLAQNAGPVWAQGEVAVGLTGIVFTSLEGKAQRAVVDDGHVGRMSPADLLVHLERARGGKPGSGAGPEGIDGPPAAAG